MSRIDELSENIVNLSKSTKDSNRFYSILLDARASTVSENTYDIADRLLRGETDNAKAALEHLWSLKKTMLNEDEVSTIDLLIQYYQKKMDVVRSKEEHIKRVSKDSRSLLEDKRKRDSELATIKQEITDCSSELKELSAKLDKLKIKEQELTLIDTQLKKELQVNENEIINGLYEIILSQQEGQNPEEDFTARLKDQASETPEKQPEAVPAEEPKKEAKQAPVVAPHKDLDDTSALPAETRVKAVAAEMPLNEEIFEVDKEKTSAFSLDMLAKAKSDADVADDVLKVYKEPDLSPFPKSVVKTTKGRVIGEYYYDAKAYKNKRHYVFNSRFFLDQLANALKVLSARSDQAVYTDLLQMIQDAFKRISENQMMHFEVSTSEFLSERALKELWHNVKIRDYAEAQRYCKRLGGKMEALRPNYYAMLKEQMGRYASE
jgi:hypothetical protein